VFAVSFRSFQSVAAVAAALFLSLICLVAPRPVSADDAGVFVGISSNPTSAVFGGATNLSVRVGGPEGGALDGASLAVQAAPFPYTKFSTIRSINATSGKFDIRVKPAINTRYRAVLTFAEGSRLLTQGLTVYVNPILRGNRVIQRPEGLEYVGARETYSRQLLKRWRKVPLRLRTMYFYQQCNGSKDFILRGQRRAKTRLNGKKMTLVFPGFTYRDSACGQRGYGIFSVGTSKLPGYLRNGDDGAGRPNSTVRGYRLWTKVAGNKRISAAKLRRTGLL
jgi:hypothetical protein